MADPTPDELRQMMDADFMAAPKTWVLEFRWRGRVIFSMGYRGAA